MHRQDALRRNFKVYGRVMWRGVALVLLLAVGGLVLPPQPARAATYANARFGYVISYPAGLLIPEPEADNGDGRVFRYRHGAGKMLVWGSYRDRDLERTPGAIAREYQADCGAGRLAYGVVKPRLVAFSCETPTGRIIYQKTLIDGDALTSVRFEYPRAARAAWAPIVKQVAGSLVPGADRAH